MANQQLPTEVMASGLIIYQQLLRTLPHHHGILQKKIYGVDCRLTNDAVQAAAIAALMIGLLDGLATTSLSGRLFQAEIAIALLLRNSKNSLYAL